MKLIEKLCNKKDMDTLGPQVLDMIIEDGNEILGEEPFIFMAMIKKANILIESELYIDIITYIVQYAVMENSKWWAETTDTKEITLEPTTNTSD